MNTIRVRFAPSPTGPLHLGSVRTALYNYLFAKQKKGKFILRIEDTDENRIIKGSKKYIIETLKWCGIEPDEGYIYGGKLGPYCQSNRIHIYKQYISKLLISGNAYYAFDTPESIYNMKLNFKKNGKIFSYNFKTRKYLDNSLNLSNEEISKRLIMKQSYVIRIKIPQNINIEIDDMIKGKISINTNNLDDKILIKSNGNPTYHIASVLDDYLMNISHIIRGEEWLPSFPIHVLIYKFFKWKIPNFAHLPLILNYNGQGKLSKRNIKEIDYPIFPLQWIDNNNKKYIGYYDIGYLPEAFLNMLALLGWNPGTKKEIFSLQELIKEFSIKNINKSGSHFNKEKAIWFNKQHIKNMSLNDVLLLINKKLNNKILIKNYNNYLLKRIFDDTLKKCQSINEIWKYSKYFFIRPIYSEEIINNININDSILYIEKIINIIYKEKNFIYNSLKMIVNNFFNTKCLNYKINIMRYIRVSLVGGLYGSEIFFIMEIIGKEESIYRLNNFKNILVKKSY